LSSGFQKSLVLYNLHRAIKAPEKRCAVVVEGYFDAMKVHQAGFPCVVARDGDEAGQAAAGELLPRLARLLFVRVAPVPQDKQPDQLSSEEVRELLAM
jgi:DNA primase